MLVFIKCIQSAFSTHCSDDRMLMKSALLISLLRISWTKRTVSQTVTHTASLKDSPAPGFDLTPNAVFRFNPIKTDMCVRCVRPHSFINWLGKYGHSLYVHNTDTNDWNKILFNGCTAGGWLFIRKWLSQESPTWNAGMEMTVRIYCKIISCPLPYFKRCPFSNSVQIIWGLPFTSLLLTLWSVHQRCTLTDR